MYQLQIILFLGGKDFSSSITMSDLSEKKEEGEDFKACRFNGSILVNRHAGTLHIISGKQINLGIGGSFHAHIQMPGLFFQILFHFNYFEYNVPKIRYICAIKISFTEWSGRESFFLYIVFF